MKNDKDLNVLEINSQANNSTYDNIEYSSKLLSNTDFEDDIFLDDILAFEKSLKENPEQEKEWLTGEETIKRARETLWNIN